MSTRDHDQKLSEDRLGTYTPGARVEPDSRGVLGRSEAAEPRSWPERAEGDGFGGAAATPYGQMVSGGSDQANAGFGGANVGGYGQQGLGSQWGQGGYGPLTQGANYSSGGSGFGPAGFAPYPEGSFSGAPRPGAAHREPSAPYERPSPVPLFGSASDFSGSAHDHHEPHYRHWRDAKIATHDREYAQWRDDQVRRYDEEYRTWRNAHHSEFSQAFEGWRNQRAPAGAAASPAMAARPGSVDHDLRDRTHGDPGAAHGANPTLGDIADGGTGAPHHRHEHEHQSHAEADRTDAVRHDPAG